MAGIPTNKDQVNNACGAIARDMLNVFDRAHKYATWLQSTPDQNFVDMGFSPQDIADVKSAYIDAEQLYQIWIGAQDLQAAKDFRVFLSRLWGMPVS